MSCNRIFQGPQQGLNFGQPDYRISLLNWSLYDKFMLTFFEKINYSMSINLTFHNSQFFTLFEKAKGVLSLKLYVDTQYMQCLLTFRELRMYYSYESI